MFWNYHSASCRLASILFSSSDFSSIGGSRKRVYEAKLGTEYYENYENCGKGGWKFDSGEVNPHWLCEEWKLF